MAYPEQEVAKMGVETISVHDSPNALEVPIEEKALSPPPPSAVPDGGIRAWLQVLGCWLVFFNVWYEPLLDMSGLES